MNRIKTLFQPSIISALLFLFVAGGALANTAPEVTNVLAEQRTGTHLVDISYDLFDADGDLCEVSVLLSIDGGTTYPISCVSVTGDVGPDVTPGATLTVVWDAGADYPDFAGDQCSIRIVGDDNIVAVGQVDLIVLLDRSGSMDFLGKWDSAVAELSAFFQAPGATDRAWLNFFPSPTGDQCAAESYNPPYTGPVSVPNDATSLLVTLNSQLPSGGTPTYAGVWGSLQYATVWRDTHSDHVTVMVLITDGSPTACNSSIDDIAAIAASAYGYNGVLTYAIGLDGASISDLDTITAAGGGLAFNAMQDANLIGEYLNTIVAAVASQ